MEQKLSVSFRLMSNVNFSMQQNYIPIMRNLILTNLTEEDIENVRVKITFEPEFARSFETTVQKLIPAVPTEISPVNIIVSSEYLCSLTEKVTGSVHIEAYIGEETAFSSYENINVLAFDQWSGTLIMPELISAFVTPNHPKVAELISKAGAYLNKWEGSPSFTGYQSKNPNIVKKQAAAIYAALQAENITYNMPPASYETTGQRVRLANTVLEQKCGTCLDLSVLYASCLEDVGLNPLIVFTRGHAFAGLWLESETFSECVEDDVSALTKRTADGIDNICLVECTDFVVGDGVEFDRAKKHADDHLIDPAEFEMAIDITRCRGSGIRPVPSRIYENGVYTTVDYGKRKESDITSAPGEIDMTLHGAASEQKEITRKEMWERKLLDLSLRNSLLNFRPTSSNVQLMTANLGELENEISRCEDFKICPVPSDFILKASDSKMFEIENEKDVVTAIAEAEFKSRRLRTFVSDEELEKTLKKLHRQSKISLEENGANTLYLALGFLRWFETDKSEKARYAPLVLIPVDIVRKIQDRSYSIRIRDEEIQMNITLLEMLRQDFGINITGLNPLPEDESGVDLPLVFNTVRQGVMAKKHWDIAEFAFLGQFSFSQFIMWNDIRTRADDLKKNKVVSSLVSGKLEWTPDVANLTPRELDEKTAPSDMAVPMSADSSQLAAIYDASEEQSFVLHGPPGTGKSQTITNMIANALYHGKSVLFVAEKMAALSVVQKRLSAIGLAPFCLELHSNKTQKRAVLKQLEDTLAVGHIKSPEEYEAQAQRLHKLRCELNETMAELYKPRYAGMSLYDSIASFEEVRAYAGVIEFSADEIKSVDAEKYACFLDAARKVSVAGTELGGYKSCLLKNCRMKAFTPEIKDKFYKAAQDISLYINAAKEKYTALGDNLPMSFGAYSLTIKALGKAVGAQYILPSAINDSEFDIRKPELEKLISYGERLTELNAEFASGYEATVLDFDAQTALMSYKQVQGKWFIPKAIGTSKAVKELALYAKEPKSVTKSNIVSIYEKLIERKRLNSAIAGANTQLTSSFGALWMGETTDFSALKSAMEVSSQIRAGIQNDKENSVAVRSVLSDFILNTDTKNRITTGFNAANNAFEALCSELDRLSSDFSVNIEEFTAGVNWFDSASAEASGFVNGIDDLKSRVVLELALDELRAQGLDNAADAYISGEADEGSVVAVIRCAVSRAVISAAFSEAPALASFQGAQFDDTVAKYREACSEFEELTVAELAAKLSSKIPDISTGNAGTSEIAILQKAIRSGGRMLPIRKLFDSIPVLLRRLCPCMLMSPISVAQYIDPNFPKFDLVIFDEASQMPTCEAVGAIARGDNVVVVGDPKQLPPTSFFMTNHVDEENFEKEDLESVLDDCLALAMPQRHLLWHYRSRHESLIAYSNAKFYDNKLLTFPSPDDLVSEVSWIKVEGSYDKGGTKQNIAEAQAIVNEIVRRLSDEELRKQSIGVVTFSVVQQILIDDMLAEEFRKNPDLEQYANEMYEPILVKNLENVQGDERDIILFSVGYGPDKDGKVSMNFGPLNRDGGWRRLNVAISRSRKGMQVYSVITPEQIDLSRTRSDGVAGLKGFLEFAAKGRSALALREADIVKSDGFEKKIAEAISEMGYETRCGIGCSAYKIDIGVVNPDKPETYALGILCDNRRLFGSTTSRDRNILQPSVLKGLGWRIYTIHILDCLDNRQKTLDRIKDAIDEAIASYRENPEKKETEAPKAPRVFSFEKEEILTAVDKCESYSPYAPTIAGTPDTLYTEASKKKLVKIIKDIVVAEGPVSRKTMLKYVLMSWGLTRSGSRVEALFDEAIAESGVKSTQSNGTTFFWQSTQNSEEYGSCRISKGVTPKRNLDDVCAEEIKNGIKLILNDQISMQREDIVRETAKLFGFTRVSGVVEASVKAGIKCAFSSGTAYLEDNRVMLRQ